MLSRPAFALRHHTPSAIALRALILIAGQWLAAGRLTKQIGVIGMATRALYRKHTHSKLPDPKARESSSYLGLVLPPAFGALLPAAGVA